jgi:hypothetical protein
VVAGAQPLKNTYGTLGLQFIIFAMYRMLSWTHGLNETQGKPVCQLLCHPCK